MLARKVNNSSKVETLVGKETTFQGCLVAESALRVDGRVEGEIRGQGEVVIGTGGTVEGDIQARDLLISGTVRGNVRLAGRLTLAAGGRLEGDIQTSKLIIEEGAAFQGHCQMDAESDVKMRPHAPQHSTDSE